MTALRAAHATPRTSSSMSSSTTRRWYPSTTSRAARNSSSPSRPPHTESSTDATSVISAVWLMSPKSMIPVINPDVVGERVVDGQVGVADLRPQPRPDRRDPSLELVEHARHRRPLARVADVVEHRAGAERVLDVPEHDSLRFGMRKTAHRLPEPRGRLAPRDERRVREPGGGDPAAPRQQVVEPHPVFAPACAQVTPVGRPRHRDPKLRVDSGDVQRDRGLHVEHVRVLGGVRHLQDRDLRLQQERAVALAAEVPCGRALHAEQRRADLDGVGGGQARPRAGQHGVHGRRD